MTDQQALQSKLWAIANELWGKMSPDEYRNYVLGFIFYKYLSEKAVSFANILLADEYPRVLSWSGRCDAGGR